MGWDTAKSCKISPPYKIRSASAVTITITTYISRMLVDNLEITVIYIFHPSLPSAQSVLSILV